MEFDLLETNRIFNFLIIKVISNTTADRLVSQGLHYTNSTIKFLWVFDKVFDYLNVSKLKQTKRKPALEPYSSPDDWRFKVCFFSMNVILVSSAKVIAFKNIRVLLIQGFIRKI